MRKDSDKGCQITIGGHDSRITKIGYFIRKYKIDELPQLWNVLFGEMSLVGPRPEVPKYVALYTSEQRKVLSVRPGITDWASIEYVNENEILAKAADPDKEYIEVIVPEKIRWNMRWVESQGVVEYFKIIFATFRKIVRGEREVTDVDTPHTDAIRKARISDVSDIVAIHEDAFPNFFLTRLGRRFLKLYYRCMCEYDGALTLCAVDVNGKLVGFSSTALQSSGFNGRLIKRNLVKFGMDGVLLLITRPGAVVHLIKNFEKKSDAIEDDGDYAELYSIGVSRSCQGKGVGSKLLSETERCVASVNHRLSLTTDKYDNDATNSFYIKNGYDVLYEFTAYPDREMYRYVKSLTNKDFTT